MSLHVLDTDCLTLLLHGHAEISRQAAVRDPAELALTIVTVEETLTGWYSQIRKAKKDDRMNHESAKVRKHEIQRLFRVFVLSRFRDRILMRTA